MFCKSCGREIDDEDKFCKQCGYNQASITNSTIKDSFINEGNGNQIGNIHNQGIIGGIKQYIGMDKIKLYENDKIDKNKVTSMKVLSISAAIATITAITTLYLNTKKIFGDNGISTTTQSKYFPLLLNIQFVFMLIAMALIVLTIVLWKKGIIKVQWYFGNLTLVNIENKVYRIKIKEVCPKCKNEPKGKLRIKEDSNYRYYITCSKNSDHRFELDHTQF